MLNKFEWVFLPMYRVLVAVDEDMERANQVAETVVDLPGHDDLAAVILNVFEEFEVTDEGGRVDSESLYDEKSIPESVESVRKSLETEGIETIDRREHGEPAETILHVAEETDANAIVMSARKRSPTGKVLFGSVTQSVLLSANRPVIVTSMG